MNTKKTADTDYLYAAARIRAVEAADVLGEKNEKMLNASDFSEACEIFRSGNTQDINSGNYQLMLDEELVKTYDFVTSMIGDTPIVSIFKYPYDCNNLKLAIKGEMCSRDCSDLYYSFGTVSVQELLKAIRERDFSVFPESMARAAFEAIEIIPKNPDPQIIDILLDKACLEDMTESAREFGCEYLTDIIKTKTDSYNILSFIRCSRMKKSALFYKKLTVDGGKTSSESLHDAYDGGLAALADVLKMTPYSDISECIERHLSQPEPGFFASIERSMENLYTSRVDEVKFISFGPEIPISYIINCEKNIKNAGIILAGKSAGLDANTIRGRLRI